MTGAAPLRMGILGTARIARSFVQGVAPSTQVSVLSVASRSREKAEEFKATHSLPRAHASYEALLQDPDIEAIYNPLPNGLHAEWSIRALEAGKHVLCEKPLAANAAEARAMFAAARAHGVHLVEGFPYLSQPQTLKMRELIEAGRIGAPRFIQASFAFTLNDASNVRWDPKLAGGALMDIGVYPLSLIRIIAKEPPARVSASALFTDSGVDRALVATLEFKSGLFGQLACSFEGGLHRRALIVGSSGLIETSYLNHTSAELPGNFNLREGHDSHAADQLVATESANGFRAEAESFARLIRSKGGWNGASERESIDVMLTVDALLKSAHRKEPVDLA
ncbi:MAG TPA: Gfo/Idh/MocA family oxidoreductase [Steroidobacteraceae bacterium]